MMLVRAAERRCSTTPNGTMTTLASPTLGGAAASLWSIEMTAGAEGPVHAFAGEVIWSVTGGSARLLIGDRDQRLESGDTVVLAGGELRQFVAGPDGFRAVATTREGEVRRANGESAGVPPWVA